MNYKHNDYRVQSVWGATMLAVLLFSACNSIKENATAVGLQATEFHPTPLITTTPLATNELSAPSLMPTFTPDTASTATPGWPITTAAQRLKVTPREEGATYAIITALLADDLGCRLPCWWGVVPGETRNEDAEKAMRLLDWKDRPVSQSTSTTQDGILLPDTLLGRAGLRLFIQTDELSESYGVIGSGDKVVYVNVSGAVRQERWQNYYIKPIFENYGLPSQVFVTINTFAKPFASLIVFYTDKGVLLDYTGFAVAELSDKNIYRTCMNYTRDVRINLHLVSEEIKGEVASEILERYFGGVNPPQIVTLEQAAGFDTQSFYDLVVNSSDVACIESPVALW